MRMGTLITQVDRALSAQREVVRELLKIPEDHRPGIATGKAITTMNELYGQLRCLNETYPQSAALSLAIELVGRDVVNLRKGIV